MMARGYYEGWEQDFYDYEPPEELDEINRVECDWCGAWCDADGIIQIDGSYLCPNCDEKAATRRQEAK